MIGELSVNAEGEPRHRMTRPDTVHGVEIIASAHMQPIEA